MRLENKKLALYAFVGLVLLILFVSWDNSRVSSNAETELYESEAHMKALFTRFQTKFSKSYSTSHEKAKRFGVFKDNVQIAYEMNRKAAEAGKNVQYGVTKFSDLTPAEFKETYLTYGNTKTASGSKTESMSKEDRRKLLLPGEVATFDPESDCPACKRFPFFANFTSTNLPTDFDWRDYGAVTAVKNQAECGSCWTFSTTGDIEGAWYLSGSGDDRPLVSLSEQQLVACDTNINSGCNGGLQELAFMFVQRVGGIVSEDAYPYKKINMYNPSDTVTKPNCNSSIVTEGHFAARINGWQYVSTSAAGESTLALSLVKAGPLAMAMNADGMQYYVSGIDEPDDCSPNELDHAVLLVGYGEEDGVEYWLIKNSWADEWGEDGYYRIARGSNLCGVAEDVLHSVVDS
jgi:C1A family cysteine protease